MKWLGIGIGLGLMSIGVAIACFATPNAAWGFLCVALVGLFLADAASSD